MKKYISIYLIFTALFATSCVEDEGTYNYATLNEVSISGLESRYELLSYVDRLQITPEIQGTLSGDNLGNFEYKWQICTGSMGDIIHQHTVISNEKDLDWLVELTPNDYTLYFTVTEKDTGLETRTYTNLNVSSSFSKGFVILGGIDGTQNVGLDMLTMAPERDTVMVEGAFDYLYNGYTNPKKLYYSGYNYGPGYMYLMTEDDAWALSLDDDTMFAPEMTFYDQGYVECEYDIKRPIKLIDTYPQGRFSYYETLSARSRFYMCNDIIVGGSSMVAPFYFVQPYNRYSTNMSDGLFNFYPYIFFTYAGYWNAYSPAGYLYDTDNDCFVQMNFNGYYSTPLSSPDTPWSFNCKSEGRKLIYGESCKVSGLSCMVMKGDDDTYYIYTIQFPATGKALYQIDLSKVTDFDKASIYAFSPARRTMLYAVGNTLYHYDYTTGNISRMEMDGEITYIKSEYNSKGSVYEFMIATWNQSTQKGMIRKYDVDRVPDDLTLTLRTNEDGSKAEEWETRLKVKDVAWFRK